MNLSQTDWMIVGAVLLALAYTYRDRLRALLPSTAVPAELPQSMSASAEVPYYVDPLEHAVDVLAAQAEAERRRKVRDELRTIAAERLANPETKTVPK